MASDCPTKKLTTQLMPTGEISTKSSSGRRDGQRVLGLVFAGSNLDNARRIFDRINKHRPRIRLTIRQRTCRTNTRRNEKPQPREPGQVSSADA